MRPHRVPITRADLEGHQRRAIVEIRAQPVPAGRIGRQERARPFVIEPRAPRHGDARIRLPRCRGPRDTARYRQLRLAVVVARLFRRRALARITLLALDHRRLRRGEREMERETGGIGNDLIAAVRFARHAPRVELDVRVAVFRIRQAEALPRDVLIVHEPSVCGIRQRRVRDDQLRGIERARALLLSRIRAKKRDLKTERPMIGRLEPARRVPPFRAIRRMRAAILRPFDRVSRRDGRERRFIGECGQRQEQPREQQNAHHQSSRTARTASTDTARRPDSTAVAHDDASITHAMIAIIVHGTCSDMLQ